MSVRRALSWWAWLLKFNVLKYTGLFFMIVGPLVFIYFNIFEKLSILRTVIGSLLLFITGMIIWLNGWDPYENILENNLAYEYMKALKKFFDMIEWYKWLLKFSLLKYIALAIMIFGPYFFFYRIIFQKMDIALNLLYSGVTVIIGIIIWIVSWDPYS